MLSRKALLPLVAFLSAKAFPAGMIREERSSASKCGEDTFKGSECGALLVYA
jgi:hypothetical protein